MKFILPLLASALVCLGQNPPSYAAFSTTSTNGGTALSWAIISARGFNNGPAAITLISAVSDLALSTASVYPLITATCKANFTNATTTLPVVQTNGFTTSDVIIIQHILNDTYEKRVLAASTGTTNLVVNAAPLQAVIPGDIIYRVSTNAANSIPLPVGAATVTFQSPCIAVGQAGRPVLVEINGTSSATLKALSCIYLNPKL